MAFMRSRSETDKKHDETRTEDRKGEGKLVEELSELSATEHPRKVSRAKNEAEAAIHDATIADIRGVALMERGRCPKCGGRTESLLFTSVCVTCGWFRRFAPEGGQCVVYLDTGDSISCDRVFSVQDGQILCVRADVVTAQLSRSAVRRIDYQWGDAELEEARDRARKERFGVCAWCEKTFDTEPGEDGARETSDDEDEDEEGPFEEYVAFGAYQERYLFCSKKCLRAFRRQYPVRIHRNCYERDCNDCDACTKRYDTQHFKRVETN